LTRSRFRSDPRVGRLTASGLDDDGDVSLEEAEELHEEGQTLLEALQEDLDVGDGTVIEQ